MIPFDPEITTNHDHKNNIPFSGRFFNICFFVFSEKDIPRRKSGGILRCGQERNAWHWYFRQAELSGGPRTTLK